MKTIITEKPSVAREIASVLNISGTKNGYMEGGEYYITWAFGHLVELCPPEEYGWKEWSASQLPMIPNLFKIRASHKYNKDKKSWHVDKGVQSQLEIIKTLFNQSDEIVVATDAGREGELIFRYIYQYTSCTKPFKRLWISSLTKKSIIKGLVELSPGSKYDNLYYSAKNRSEADWLVGMNASRALSIAAGKGTFSLGRVQTPTLSIICSRYIENKEFKSTPYYNLRIKLEKGTIMFDANSDQIVEKSDADYILTEIKKAKTANVVKVDKKEVSETPPLLYDLTTLQREANKYLKLTADETLKTAQSLYEQKLITYPRTGSCFISEDVFETIPELITIAKSNPKYGISASKLSKSGLNKRCVNDEKITDHHAILITESNPENLRGRELEVYELILSRMVEAFSSPCVKDSTVLTIDCAGIKFKSSGSIIVSIGWKEIRAKVHASEVEEELGNPDNQILPNVSVDEILEKTSEELLSKATKPKPLLNEATLLASMETCGRMVEDETLKEALKDCGIGTPATRANIIETLLFRGYIEREKRLLIPTPKGLTVHNLLKSKPIASAELTGQWEKRLNHISLCVDEPRKFMDDIKEYTKQITLELLGFAKNLEQADLSTTNQARTICPKCNKGEIKKGEKNYWCTAYKDGCDFKIWLIVGEKKLTDKQVFDLLQKRKTTLIKGFKNKTGKEFDALLVFDSDNRIKYEYPSQKS